MQYAFITLALTAATTFALPTPQDGLVGDVTSTVNGIANLDGVTAGVGLKQRGLVGNAVDGTVKPTLDNTKDTVNNIQVRDVVTGLVGTVDETVDGLPIVKRELVGNVVDDVKSTVNGVKLNQRGVVGNTVDSVRPTVGDAKKIVNGVEAKRDLVSGTANPLLSDVTDTVDGLDLGVKRDVVGNTLSDVGPTVDETVGSLNLKRQSGDALKLGSGAVGSLVGSEGVLDLSSGTVDELASGLNADETVSNVVKRQESGDALKLGSGAVGSLVGSEGVLDLSSGTVDGLASGLNADETVSNVVKRQESGDALKLGSGAVGSVVGSDGVLDLSSGTVDGLASGLNADETVSNVLKRGVLSQTVADVKSTIEELLASLSAEELDQLLESLDLSQE